MVLALPLLPTPTATACVLLADLRVQSAQMTSVLVGRG
jgi:hypothetical protein